MIRERAERIVKINQSKELQLLEWEACRRDIFYWFEHYAWTYDPRPNPKTGKPIGPVPFKLYPYQVDVVLALTHSIDIGENLIVEKPRDMGITWLMCAVGMYYWLFRPQSHGMMASYEERLVDSQGDLKTLFPKLRFILAFCPAWMRPTGYNERYHSGHMKLINPANGSTITGDSINVNLGRSGRALWVFIDEMAFALCNDQFAYESVIQTSPCVIMASTPRGKLNHYYRLQYDPKIEEKPKQISLDWWMHPGHDDAWFEKQKRKYTKTGLAREILKNYSDSMEGAVFQNFERRYHVSDDCPTYPQPDTKVIASFDFGGTCAALLASLDSYGCLTVHKEFLMLQSEKASTEALGLKVVNYLSLPPKGVQPIALRDVHLTGDPAGRNKPWQKDPESSSSDYETLRHLFGLNNGFNEPELNRIIATKNRLDEGVKLLRNLFNSRANGVERIVIHPSCKYLIEALEGEYHYHITPNGEITDQIKEVHPVEDIVDVLRYIALQFMSVYVAPEDEYQDAGFLDHIPVYYPI